ncbi:hypothetical protein FIBSPDRAFT_855780 [Athelia psychrophila]|uniref:Uncharacterized protein n=1 Tax=Athelia psychrophila TaxID=1759441 RepID=A0A166P0V2_9AGAM|nr:hypothetical protein FIBSPDRAFT_855780 [Fibularhizoctonia sp. CBS 109695]
MSTVTFESSGRFVFECQEDKRSDSPSSSRRSSRSYKSSASARSPSKFVHRQVLRAWKSMTRATQKSHHASILPSDFVIVTGRGSNRRSVLFA